MANAGASDLMSRPSLSDQVSGETEEQRKKRLQALEASKALPVGMSALTGNSLGSGYGSAVGMG